MRLTTITVVTALLMALAGPARAHTRAEVDELKAEALTELASSVINNGTLTLEAMEAYLTAVLEAEALYTPPPTKTAPRPSSSASPAPSSWVQGAEQWRPLVAAYFPASMVDYALAVIWCESRGDPTADNPTSSAAGLFQHLGRYWSERSAAAGVPGASIYDPEASTIVAAWLVLEAPGGGWHHWTCRP